MDGGKEERKRKALSVEGQKCLQVETLSFFSFFFFFFFLFRIVSTLQHRGRKDGLVYKGRGTVDSSELAPVPLYCRHTLLQTSCATLSKSSPPSALPPPLQNGLNPCLLVSGKDTQLGGSSSQSLEGSCREEREKAPGSKLPAIKCWSCIVPCKGSRAEELSSFFQPHILMFNLF